MRGDRIQSCLGSLSSSRYVKKTCKVSFAFWGAPWPGIVNATASLVLHDLKWKCFKQCDVAAHSNSSHATVSLGQAQGPANLSGKLLLFLSHVFCPSNCMRLIFWIFCATTNTGNFKIAKKNFKHSVHCKDKLITIKSSVWTQMGNLWWFFFSLYTLLPCNLEHVENNWENLIPTWSVFLSTSKGRIAATRTKENPTN